MASNQPFGGLHLENMCLNSSLDIASTRLADIGVTVVRKSANVYQMSWISSQPYTSYTANNVAAR